MLCAELPFFRWALSLIPLPKLPVAAPPKWITLMELVVIKHLYGLKVRIAMEEYIGVTDISSPKRTPSKEATGDRIPLPMATS
jgi:hypothetical protein